MNKTNHLSLKWGTLKAWNFQGMPEAMELLQQYNALGSSRSAMSQRDTPEQKALICQMIDLMPGDIYLEWTDRYVAKDEAKNYVLEYGLEENAQ